MAEKNEGFFSYMQLVVAIGDGISSFAIDTMGELLQRRFYNEWKSAVKVGCCCMYHYHQSP